MSEYPAEQLIDRAQAAHRKQKEHERMWCLLEERVEEMNANTGNLPEIVMKKGYSLQLGQFTLYIEFDQQLSDPSEYVLVLRVGQPREPLFGSGPAAVKRRLRPAVSDDRRSIVWINAGDVRRFDTADVVQLALDMIIGYYEEHKRN